mgnify:FL=1|tara:strand:+ start:407 stop:727 length:321 start_codon:yes stop_codon:yes gene_type:complete
MFGNKNMEEMMSQLQNMQGAVEDSKKRLETIYVKGDALEGKIRFILDGNRNLKELNIDDDIFKLENKDELINEMISAFNKAIENANHVNENELKSTAFNMFPGMGK